MPELPPAKRRPQAQRVPRRPARNVDYAELHCRTNYSFLEGASHPDELAARAAELGYTALGITDRNSLAGVVRAHVAAKEAGLKLLIGAEITPLDAAPVLLWAMNRAGYGRLARLLTHGRRSAPKGECRLTLSDLADHAEGLLAGVLLRRSSDSKNPADDLRRYLGIFGDRCYGVAELHRGPDDQRLLQWMMQTVRTVGVPIVAANDVHYHIPERRPLQDVLTAIRHGCTVANLGERIFANAERCLKSPAEMSELFAACPEAVANTVCLAQRCSFSLDELRYEYPEELCPAGMTPLEYLTQLTWQGAGQRYGRGGEGEKGRKGEGEKGRRGEGLPFRAQLRAKRQAAHSPPLPLSPSPILPPKVRRLIEHELQLIAELHYEAYFLTVWDLVQFARGRGILCQGRGSAANSAVCFCLGITSVDPERIDVLFERFVSKERDEAPDIDVDFEHERREEVLQYIYGKYGRDRAGMTAEVITYQVRSAVRDVGKALGLSPDRVDVLAKAMDHHSHDQDKLAGRLSEAGFAAEAAVGRQLIELVRQILGFPRHLSQHVGGMIITRGLLCELVPIENAAMAERTVVQWDKNDLDALGILKVDCLALGMLSAIHKCFDLIERAKGRKGEGGSLPRSAQMRAKRQAAPSPLLPLLPEDPAVYDMISRADTVGVFQIESRAQMSMLPRLKPRCFYDLVIEVAIVRPGPIQGDMVHPYLRRRAGLEAVDYPDERIKKVLEKTLGVPIFQEQAMRLAVVAAGFTPGEADQLRRAMGAWRRRGVMEPFRQKLVNGMLANGYSADFADRVFRQIQGFGEYGFPESHAASFALLVYISAWLKLYHPAAFACALLNSQPMGFYAPAQLVADAQRHGVHVLPIDVNRSQWDCTLERDERRDEGRGMRDERRDEGRGMRDEGRGNEAGLPFSARRHIALNGKSDLSLPHPSSLIPHPSSSSLIPHPSSLSLRLGFRLVHGLSPAQVAGIVAAPRPFRSYQDFVRRTGLRGAVLKKLAQADAFHALGLGRRPALWQSLPQGEPLPLFEKMEVEEPLPATLPAMAPLQEVLADYSSAGLSLRQHPMAFLRAELDRLGVAAAHQLAVLPTDSTFKVAGLVLLRQRPSTAKGITFVTLEDETGMANLIVRQNVWERYRRVARLANVMLAHGRLQRDADVIHVLVTKLEDLSPMLAQLNTSSRDFR